METQPIWSYWPRVAYVHSYSPLLHTGHHSSSISSELNTVRARFGQKKRREPGVVGGADQPIAQLDWLVYRLARWLLVVDFLQHAANPMHEGDELNFDRSTPCCPRPTLHNAIAPHTGGTSLFTA